MKVAIIYYSTYGHVAVMAKEYEEGIESADVGVQADILQVKETLSEEVLGMLHAPEKLHYPVASTDTLVEYDAFCIWYSYQTVLSQHNGLISGALPVVYGLRRFIR